MPCMTCWFWTGGEINDLVDRDCEPSVNLAIILNKAKLHILDSEFTDQRTKMIETWLTYQIWGNCWYIVIIFLGKTGTASTPSKSGSIPWSCPQRRCRYHHHKYFYMSHISRQTYIETMQQTVWRVDQADGEQNFGWQTKQEYTHWTLIVFLVSVTETSKFTSLHQNESGRGEPGELAT